MAKIIRAYSLSSQGSLTLTKNFRVKEFACKDGSDVIFIAEDLPKLLQQIRDHFGKPVIINSAYRTVTYNDKVGGATKSQHTYGCAADIVVSGVSPLEVYKYADSILKTGGVGKYSTFTHVDVREKKARF